MPDHGIWYLNLAILLIVAVLTRAHQYWNPVAHLDDQFYLLVGKMLLRGELPYIDIWDRKPFGLFLLYSGIAALGGKGVIQAQLVATVFAASTAFVISRIGDRIARFPGGLLAGVIYLVLLPMFSGATGQAPVFYNLPMAIAGLLTFDSWRDPDNSDHLRRGLLAMAAVGVSITLKPTVIFEGCCFGLIFLFVEWRRAGSLIAVGSLAARLTAVAMTPTAAVNAFYWANGGLDDLWLATVVSVLTKASLPPLLAATLFSFMAIRLAVPTIAAFISLRRLSREEPRTASFFAIWLGAATIGMLSIPNFFDHYALPFLVPLTAVLAVLLAEPLRGLIWTTILVVFGTAFSNSLLDFSGKARAAKFERTAALVVTHLNGGCLYIYEGPVHLYTATNACRLTRFVFPDHLNSAIEANAIPVDQSQEIARIFAGRPTVVVEAKRVLLAESPASRRILKEQLACNYHIVGIFNEFGARFKQPLYIWARRPGWRNCAVS